MSDKDMSMKNKDQKSYFNLRFLMIFILATVIGGIFFSGNAYAKTSSLKAPNKINVSTTKTSATLKWSGVSGAKSYNVYMYNSKTKKYVLKKTTSSKMYTVNKLESYTWYRFIVKAAKDKKGKQTGLSSKVIKAQTKAIVLAAPTKFTVSTKTTSATLKWNKISKAKAYNVYMYDSVKKKYVLKKTVTTNSYSISKLNVYTSYKFRINAALDKNGKHPGKYSKVVTAKTQEIKATKVSLNKTSVNIAKGKKYVLKATLAPVNTTRKNITWTSNKTSVATVSSTGEITAVEQGTCVIRATSVNGKYQSCKVTVTKPEYADAVRLDKAAINLQEGETDLLKATVVPSNVVYNKLTWKSSDEKIATVSDTGVVSFVSEGECIITVSMEGGISSQCTVCTHPVVECKDGYVKITNAYKSYDSVLFVEGNASTKEKWDSIESVKKYIAVNGKIEAANFKSNSSYTFKFVDSDKTYYFVLTTDGNTGYDELLASMPVVNLKGDTSGMTIYDKDIEASVELEYSDESQSFSSYAKLKYQGSSSLNLPKKNYNIKLYEDSEYNDKNKVVLRSNWGKQNKYTLKANYVDATQARNISAAEIYSQVLDSHENLCEQLKESPNNGVIEGYPAKVYLNGKYQGIYTINIPKDTWMNNMGSKGKQAIVSSNQYGNSSYMKSEIQWQPTDTDISFWEVEEKSKDFSDEEIKDSLNKLAELAQTSDKETFLDKANEYIDVSMYVDYYLTSIFLCSADNFCNNILWITYDGKKWMPSAYDLDGSLGFEPNPVVGPMFPTNFKIPYWNDKTKEYYTYNENIIMCRILNFYFDDFKARYKELRDNGVFSLENVKSVIGNTMDKIPSSLYEQEKNLWPKIPANDIDQRQEMINFMDGRIQLLDQFFQYK